MFPVIIDNYTIKCRRGDRLHTVLVPKMPMIQCERCKNQYWCNNGGDDAVEASLAQLIASGDKGVPWTPSTE